MYLKKKEQKLSVQKYKGILIRKKVHFWFRQLTIQKDVLNTIL